MLTDEQKQILRDTRSALNIYHSVLCAIDCERLSHGNLTFNDMSLNCAAVENDISTIFREEA